MLALGVGDEGFGDVVWEEDSNFEVEGDSHFEMGRQAMGKRLGEGVKNLRLGTALHTIKMSP